MKGKRLSMWRFFMHAHFQALHGLAPKCNLLNMHEMIYKSTNNYVTSFEMVQM